jgi:hypothetical protein
MTDMPQPKQTQHSSEAARIAKEARAHGVHIDEDDLLRVPETLPSGLVADLKKYDREVVDILMDEWATKLRQGAKAKASAVAELDRLHARLQAMRAMMEAYKAGVTLRLDGGKVKVAGPNASREVHLPILRQYEQKIAEILTDASPTADPSAYDTFMAAGYLEMSEDEKLKFIAGYQAARKGNGSVSDWGFDDP